MSNSKRSIIIEYNGLNWLSRNKIDVIHWTKKEKIKQSLYKELNLKPFTSVLTNYKVKVVYCSRYDVDNVTGGLKMLLDLIVKKGGVIDDSPKYFKSLEIIYDATLKKNTYITEIIEL